MRAGQTLIEVLIAFAVTVLIGVGLVSAGLSTQRAAASARNEAQATKLAQEYIERVRVMRDSRGWDDFKSSGLGDSNGNFDVTTPDPNVISTWVFANSWSNSAPTYCLGNLGGSSPLEGKSVKAGNTEFCRKVRVTNNSSTALGISVAVEVGWKEGENIKSSKAETVISRWCGATITGVDASPCP